MEYNYLEAIKDDVREYINSEFKNLDELKARYSTKEEIVDFLDERLWVVDSVTGNASGSYTFNAYMAEEYLCHNMDILREALNEFGVPEYLLDHSAEYFDVTIRCYLLDNAIVEVVDELFPELLEY